MQKLGMIQAFVELGELEDATFAHPQGNEDQARLIKMRILAEKPVNMYIVPVEYQYPSYDENGQYQPGRVTAHHEGPEFVRFLAHVEPGLEQIEFYYRGSFCLRLMGGGIWLDTYDNTAFNIESVDPVSFARMYEREERDPRILEIERAARHNSLMLQQQMEADRAQFIAMMEAMKNNVTPAPSASGTATASAGTEGTSVPPADDQEPDQSASGGTGGQS